MSSLFDQLLNAYWLRPETALWRFCDTGAMAGFHFESPSLDLGCGDGVFSLIRANAELSPYFDVFQSVAHLDRYFDKADVYDVFDDSFHIEITREPDYQIDVGFDHKPNLLKKAGVLGLYRELKRGDANQTLPFADQSFRSIFSNIVYWLDDPAGVFGEIRRVLRPGGRACLLLPNPTLRDFSFYWQFHKSTENPAFTFLELLDRGRIADNVRQVKSKAQWVAALSAAGLDVIRHTAYLSRPIVQTWDVGLRPLFPALVAMASFVPKERLLEIKQTWIAALEPLLRPLAEMDGQLDKSTEPAFHCFEVSR